MGRSRPAPYAGFSFIYSNLVLQHAPRPFAKNYLREFVRLLAPAGKLVYRAEPPRSGYVGKQYCVVASPVSAPV
jgi:hypothetical protein